MGCGPSRPAAQPSSTATTARKLANGHVEVIAPTGKLHKGISFEPESTVVSEVRETSPLYGRVEVGWTLVAVDGVAVDEVSWAKGSQVLKLLKMRECIPQGRLEFDPQGRLYPKKDEELQSITSKMPKALVVYGSESGTAEKAIKELAAEWKKGTDWSVVDIIDGNAAAKQGLETLAANHDAIIIATSSFRQGDAPYNYDDFLGALYRATFKADSPFQGCQHAVLGFGDSHFDTYMNCPRLIPCSRSAGAGAWSSGRRLMCGRRSGA